jgi:transglutaminase superfamily protein
MGHAKMDRCQGFLMPWRGLIAGLVAIVLLCGCGGPDSTNSVASDRSAPVTSPGSETPTGSIADRKTWDITYMQGQQVGYGWTSVTSQIRDQKNVLQIEGYSLLSVKRFGHVLKMETRFTSTETPDGGLVEFSSEMPQGAQSMKSLGRVAGDTLELSVTSGGKSLDQKIPWRDEYGGPYAVELSLLTQPMTPGEKRSISHFDVAVAMLVTTSLVAKDYEDVELPGGKQELLQIDSTIDFAGQTLKAAIWADRTGEVLKTRINAMGLEVVRATEAEALAGSGDFSFDLGKDVMVAVKRSLSKPHDTRRIVYRLRLEGGNPCDVFPSGYSQSIEPVDENTARVTVWAIRPDSDWGNRDAVDDAPNDDDREPNTLIQSDDPLVVEISKKAKGNETDPWKAAIAMESYVARHMTKSGFSTAFASAAEVAKSRTGDCTEHAVLLAAMARAAGIPARVAMGLVYYQSAYAYHMWTEVHVDGRWIPLDATLGKGGVGAAHLKVAHSNLKGASPYTGFLPVLKIIGQLKIEVEEARW